MPLVRDFLANVITPTSKSHTKRDISKAINNRKC
ncbi:MAG: hypothetical protein JWO30_4091 [Fibrobacteres bacterium]|nr:hypothetical protein [Fibrobacterota bacterium]